MYTHTHTRARAGLPLDLLAPFPAIRAFRHQVASLPGVVAWYEQPQNQDAVRQAGYRPDGSAAPTA
jgi:hypothetical protein